MKKTALAVAICGSLGFSAAHAATVSEFANGVLVPYVFTDVTESNADTGDRTAIGLTSCAEGTVYWTFFGQDSAHLADGQFFMSANDQVNIVWGNAPLDNQGNEIGGLVRPTLANTPGYMVFVLDTNTMPGLGMLDSSDSPCLAGNAFQIDFSANDVAFTPTLPLDAAVGDFGPPTNGIYVSSLNNMGPTTVAGLNAGANLNDDIYLRYFIDGAAGGNDTTIYIWATGDASSNPNGNTVNIYDLNQNFFSINLNVPDPELSIMDAENDAFVQNRPAEMVDGFIIWTVHANAGDVVSWSVVESDAIGAAQTVMNPIRQLNLADGPVYRIKVQQPAGADVSEILAPPYVGDDSD